MKCPSCKENRVYYNKRLAKHICKNCGWVGILMSDYRKATRIRPTGKGKKK